MVTKAQAAARVKAEIDAAAQAQYDDIVDAATLNPALDAIKAELGVTGDLDATVYVYKMDVDGQNTDYRIWASDDPDTFNLETLARSFGSGRYRVRVYAKDAEGRKLLQVNKIQAIMLSPADQAKYEASKNPATVQHNGVDIREALRETLAPVVALFNRAPPDPFAQMQQLAGLMKTLMPVPVAAVAPGPDLMSMLTMLKTLKELTGNDVPADATVTEKLLLKAADAFMPHVAAGMQAQGGAPAPAETPPVAVPALEAPKPELPIDEEAEQMKIIDRLKVEGFKLQLIAANKAAARGVDPVTYADGIYDMFDDADIHGIATQANWFAMMCEAVPGCKVHEAWYGAMRGAIIDIAVDDGALLRDEAGNLTVSGDSGTTDASEPEGGTHGAVDAGTGSAAAESKPV